MIKKIYIGGISSTTTDKKLFDHFSQVGKVISVTIAKGINPQKHAGYAYIVMDNEKDTQAAIHKLNNSKLDNSRIRVIPAHFLDQERRQYYHRRY